MGIFPYRILLFTLIINCLNAQNHTPKLIKDSIYSPELGGYKTIRILLPEGYDHSKERHPVIYMHDAQNLFDSATAYAGEWEVDETMSKTDLPYIVVGIDHGNEKRIDELTPYTHPEYGGGKGETYVAFMTHTLKPYIDKAYRTLKDRDNTFIAGSSLGGLISHYTLFTHSDIFGGAILFSPSYWYSELIYALTPKPHANRRALIYLASGALEPGSTVSNHRRMADSLIALGYTEKNLKTLIREGAGHNEAFWKEEFPKALNWLHQKRMEKQENDRK